MQWLHASTKGPGSINCLLPLPLQASEWYELPIVASHGMLRHPLLAYPNSSPLSLNIPQLPLRVDICSPPRLMTHVWMNLTETPNSSA